MIRNGMQLRRSDLSRRAARIACRARNMNGKDFKTENLRQ